jgi:hypothetical protein
MTSGTPEMVAALDGIRGRALRVDRNRRDALRRGQNINPVTSPYLGKTAGAWLPSWLPVLARISKNGVGRTRFELVTSSVSGKRSPAELTARVPRRDATRARTPPRAANGHADSAIPAETPIPTIPASADGPSTTGDLEKEP